MWSFSTGFTSYRKITLFFKQKKPDCPRFLKVNGQCWFYFQTLNDVILTQIPQPPERSSRWRQRAHPLLLSLPLLKWGCRYIPGLHRRAALPGVAGWYNPWGCPHLLQKHSVKSESTRKEEMKSILFLSGKVTKEVENTHTPLRCGEGRGLFSSFILLLIIAGRADFWSFSLELLF